MIYFGLVLWHINYCRLFNTKSSLYIYIEVYDLLWLISGISNVVGHLKPYPLYIYIKYI